MSAAAPTTATTLPDDLEQRQASLNKLTIPALKATFLKAGVTPPPSGGKPVLVSEGAKNDTVMLAHGWGPLGANPTPIDETPADGAPAASTGNVDQNGDVIGGTPTDPYDCDEDGFPAEKTDVEKLDDDHLDALGGWLYTHPDFPNPPGYSQTITATIWQAPRAEKIAFIMEHAYVDEPADSTPAAGDTIEGEVHIPTAAPEPTTVTTDELARINADKEGADAPEACACNGTGGYETPGGWEKCEKCDGAVEGDGQLSFVPGSDPTKFVLNIPSVRVDMAGVQLGKYDEVDVRFRFKVEETRRPPEKQGKTIIAEMETYVGTVLVDTIEITRV